MARLWKLVVCSDWLTSSEALPAHQPVAVGYVKFAASVVNIFSVNQAGGGNSASIYQWHSGLPPCNSKAITELKGNPVGQRQFCPVPPAGRHLLTQGLRTDFRDGFQRKAVITITRAKMLPSQVTIATAAS